MIDQILRVTGRLTALGIENVLVGGASVGLLLTDPAASPARFTNDVDVIVPTRRRSDYDRMGERLRESGYSQPAGDEHPICRWIIDDLLVDIMPPIEEILGFSNSWYQAALDSAVVLRLSDEASVKVIDAPHLLACKLEAHFSRGAADPVMSTDLTDIIVLVEGRKELTDEAASAPAKLRRFISRELQRLIDVADFEEILAGHLPPDEVSQQRASLVMKRLRAMAALDGT